MSGCMRKPIFSFSFLPLLQYYVIFGVIFALFLAQNFKTKVLTTHKNLLLAGRESSTWVLDNIYFVCICSRGHSLRLGWSGSSNLALGQGTWHLHYWNSCMLCMHNMDFVTMWLFLVTSVHRCRSTELSPSYIRGHLRLAM